MSEPAHAAPDLLAHLVARGVISTAEAATVVPLDGGVSNDVVAVVADGTEVVVKRALPRLRVESEWTADVERLQTEGAALALAHELAPGTVPRVLDLDGGYLVLERGPRHWTNWRDELIGGRIDTAQAAALGAALGHWQSATAEQPAVLAPFRDRTVFHQLRVDPFYGAVARRHPDLAPAVDAVVARMLSRTTCLVHGDYTPKNMLVAPDTAQLWVLDWEVAHVGDPEFDPALLLTHLVLKSIHRPAAVDGYAACAAAFLAALGESSAAGREPAGLCAHMGCLLLARVDGTSPATYLGPDARTAVRELGRRLVLGGYSHPLAVWEAWR